jgi:hypothetical protein
MPSDETTPLLRDQTDHANPDPPPAPAPAGSTSNANPTSSSSQARDTNFQKFRNAIGIHPSADMTNPSPSDLEAARKKAQGIYAKVISLQTWRRRQYQAVETIYYVAIGTQIVIGAVLTALGPISGQHSKSITILGIVNTATAGVIALLKGQGLPDRLRKDEFEMRKVQDYIEAVDARLSLGVGEISDEELDELVQRVFAKYNAARDTAELNKPDSYGHQSEEGVHPSTSGTGEGQGLVAGAAGGGARRSWGNERVAAGGAATERRIIID